MTGARRHDRNAGWAGAVLVLGPLLFGLIAPPARGDQVPRAAAIAGPGERSPRPRPFPPRGAAARRGEGPAGPSGGWWFGTAGLALALALFGGFSLASRRFLPRAGSGGFLGVVGRAGLSPRHSVYLLKVGQRVLIVGTGPQGAPSLLGELTEPADLRRFAPGRPAPVGAEPAPDPVARGSDRPLGDDE